MRFFVGLVVFLGGMGVNIWSDRVLVAQPIQVMEFSYGVLNWFLCFDSGVSSFFFSFKFQIFFYLFKKKSQNDVVLAQLMAAPN